MHPCPDCGSRGKHYSHCHYGKVEKNGKAKVALVERDEIEEVHRQFRVVGSIDFSDWVGMHGRRS